METPAVSAIFCCVRYLARVAGYFSGICPNISAELKVVITNSGDYYESLLTNVSIEGEHVRCYSENMWKLLSRTKSIRLSAHKIIKSQHNRVSGCA